jgi:L-lactate dehydrogenase complex protein LldG
MHSLGQQAFIGRIRSALGHAADVRRNEGNCCTAVFADETGERLDRIKHRTAAEKQRLLQRLIEMAEPINLNVMALKDENSVAAAIADLVKNKSPEWGNEKSVVTWQHPLIERLNLSEALAPQKVPVHVTELREGKPEEKTGESSREILRRQVIDAYIGITSADFCMADTATLVMRTRPGQARSASLVPSIHIAVIHLDQIILDLKELYALLQWDPQIREDGLTNCMTFISGPSKTADVEATMVHGAHGPREVYIYVTTD